jgi:hypothetical protein
MSQRMNTTNSTARSLSALAVLCAAAAPALAQTAQGGGASVGGRFSHPLSDRITTVTGQQPATTTQSQTRVMMSKTDGDDSYELTINGDKATAKVNGKEVPQERVRHSDGKYEILDKDGNVLTTFEAAAIHHFDSFSPGTMRLWAGPNGALAMGGPNSTGFGGTVQAGPAPKVMLGVTMVEPSESLTEHLDIEPGTGVLLNSVMEGLPADKAGLKKGDVIVSFDGTRPITVATAREILAKKKAGDKVQVVVLRKGDEKTVSVELQKFDPAKLAPAEGAGNMGWEGAGPDAEKMRKQLENSFKQGGTWSTGPGAQGFVFGPGQDKLEVFSSPNSGEMKERMAALDKKLSELDEKMSKLDDQLTRLEKKLDKLNSR